MSKLRNAILMIALVATTPCLQAAEERGDTLDQLVTEALAGNPELSAELGSKSVRDLSGNNLGDGAVWAVSLAQTCQREFGLGVSLPLPLWDQKMGHIETAKARQLQAEISLNVTLREIERRIAETAHTYRTQVEEMGQWRADSLDRFREAAALGNRSELERITGLDFTRTIPPNHTDSTTQTR